MVDFSALDRTVLQTLQMPEDATIYYTAVEATRKKLTDVIFRSPAEPIIGDDLQFEGVGPQFSVHRDDCPDLAQGDIFERDDVEYIVTEVIKDEGYIWVAHCRLTSET